MYPRRTVLFATIVALLGAVYSTTESGAQPRPNQPLADVPPHWRALAERLTRYYQVEIVKPKFCAAEFTVDFVFLNPHLRKEDKIFVTGPMPGTGNFTFHPVPKNPQGPWDHPWQNQAYTGYPIPVPPGQHKWFDLPTVPVEAHDNTPAPPGLRPHQYKLEVEEWEDDCPKYIVFHSRGHLNEPLSDDPGHAGAIR